MNVLLALSVLDHTASGKTKAWFERNGCRGWATCPLTQAGFVRVLANPGVSAGAISAGDALAALAQLLRHPAHQFWPDDLDVSDAVAGFGRLLRSHQQVTDAYLLGLTLRRGASFVTLDRGVRALLAADSPLQAAIITL